MLSSYELQYETIIQYRPTALLYAEQIDELLQMQDEKNLYVLLHLFQKEGFIDHYLPAYPKLSYAVILTEIARNELMQSNSTQSFTRFLSIDEIKQEWQIFKFSIWEYEFLHDDSALEALLQYKQTQNYSDSFLQAAVERMAYNPNHVFTQINAMTTHANGENE